MKLSLISVFLILFCLQNKQAKAQAYIYHPFSTDTVKWIYYTINDVVAKGCYTSYIQAGDTSFVMFPGKFYKKIYGGGGSIVAYIRIENKIIYKLSLDLAIEYELYNFTKTNVGDTLNFYNSTGHNYANKAKIIAYDSLLTLNGLDYYKVYKLNFLPKANGDFYGWSESCSYAERNYLAEGIGCFPDLLQDCLDNSGCACENNHFFNTLIINRDTIIKNLFFDCKLTGINEKENVVEKNINVYPNPTDAILKINACDELQSEEKTYFVYDMLGNKLIEKKDRNCSVELNTKQLKNGNYIWLITTEKKSYTGKIIINH